MANKIDILIKAKDEASKEIEGVTDSLEDLEGGADELEKTGSKSFGDFMDNVAIAMLGINQAIEIGMKIAEAAKRVYEATVGKALDIAKEVETLSRISGDAPENISALRIAAQEAGVGFDDLYKALENLNKNGVAPTVENLVAIANEYINLEDPIAKATLLTEYFGTAGDEIAPMLEAIADGVKEVQNAGLIFTEADIQNAKNYTAALEDFQVAKEGFLVKLGNIFLPSFTEILQNLSGQPTEMANLFDDLYAAADKALFAGSINADTWQLIIKDATTVTGSYSDQVAKLKFHLGVLNDMNGDTAGSTEELTEAEILAAEAASLAAAEQEKLNTTITGAVLNLGQKYTPILKDISEKEADIAELNQIIANDGGMFDGVWMSAEEAATKVLELETEIQNARIAMQGLAAQAVAGIAWGQITADGKVTLEEITRYYDYLVQAGIMTADAGKQAIQDFMDYWDLWDPEAKTLPVEVLLDTTEVDQWDAPAKYALVHYRPDSDYIPEAAGGAVHAAASGLAASLPHYWVGELGPEPFFPATNGRIVSNTQAMSALRGGTNAGDIADAVKKGVKEAMRDGSVGSVYNLTMPTSSNPADIRMAFELMEAWGT